MGVKDMVVKRFEELCAQRNVSTNQMAYRSGVTPSTAYSMLDPRRKEISIVTIKKFCDGLDITLGEFFSTPEFDQLEQEIMQRTVKSEISFGCEIMTYGHCEIFCFAESEIKFAHIRISEYFTAK